MNAADGEQILLKQKAHWGIFVLPCLAIVLTALPFLAYILFLEKLATMLNLPGAFRLAWLWFVIPGLFCLLIPLAFVPAYLSYEVTLTQQRIKFRIGVFSRRSGEIPLQKVESIFLVEPLLGRLLGYGTVVVVGTGGTPLALTYLPHAQVFHFELQRAVQGISSPRNTEEARTPPPEEDSRYMPKG